MAPYIHFKTGETINYNGQKAVVVEAHSYSSYITIEVNGEKITVDRNDLFGMNNAKNYYDERIADCDERIERNWGIIKLAEKVYDACANVIKACRKGMARILAELNVKSADNITDISKRKEYLSLSDEKAYNKVLKNRASADIMSAAIDTGSVCSTKMNLINQQAVVEYFT